MKYAFRFPACSLEGWGKLQGRCGAHPKEIFRTRPSSDAVNRILMPSTTDNFIGEQTARWLSARYASALISHQGNVHQGSVGEGCKKKQIVISNVLTGQEQSMKGWVYFPMAISRPSCQARHSGLHACLARGHLGPA